MNLFELFVKIGVDDQASGTIETLSKKLCSGLKTAAKVGAAAVGTAAAGITALTKQAVSSFAEYEQLAGGAAKIFDEMSQTQILQDAQNAYKDLGISANQYLAIINDVGATFAATMGDEAGYNTAKIGLQAISDYASGTGKNVDELSQKFTLITRSTSSYQSIADQFSGILPATSAAFLEQAQAAGILGENYTKLTEVPVAEYQAAVSQMLERGVEQIGLAGNTVAEATTTASGSVATMKAAWSNLVTGIADGNADIDVLLDNFLEPVGVTAKNVFPIIKTVLSNIFDTLKENAPEMLAEGVLLLAQLAAGLIEGIPDLIGKIPQIIKAVVTEFKNRGPEFKSIGKDIVRGLWDGISAMASWIRDKVSGFMSGLVTGAKKVLGIQSPSKVFSEMGGYMAKGLGIGWDKEYSGVKRQIESGLAFNTASVDFASSGVGKRLAATDSTAQQPIFITVQSVLDGKIIGESSYQYAKNKERMYGLA